MTVKQYNAMVDYVFDYNWPNGEDGECVAYIHKEDIKKFMSAFKTGKAKGFYEDDGTTVTFNEFKKFLLDFTDMREEEVYTIFPVGGLDNL